MAGASDKARFFLEQTVPELREWERRELFTREEISSIAAKRSDFEHIINARGAQPADFARYAEYEMNLDSLRRKRIQRKRVKSTTHTGQQRIFSILKRATTKFPAHVPLWMQYVEYARKQHANKRVVKILTSMLRLHSTKPDLWIYAARYAFDVLADITAARGYMQRALRFCPQISSIHLEYARLEISHLAKIWARRSVLGMDTTTEPQTGSEQQMDETAPDLISLNAVLSGDGPGDALTTNDQAIDDGFASSPLMKGAIPLAIFNAAVDRFQDDAAGVGQAFFDMFLEYNQLPCTPQILDTVTQRLMSVESSEVLGLSCKCRLPIASLSYQDLEFPVGLRASIAQIRLATSQVSTKTPELADAILSWLSPLAEAPDLLPELKQVLRALERQLNKTAQAE